MLIFLLDLKAMQGAITTKDREYHHRTNEGSILLRKIVLDIGRNSDGPPTILLVHGIIVFLKLLTV